MVWAFLNWWPRLVQMYCGRGKGGGGGGGGGGRSPEYQMYQLLSIDCAMWNTIMKPVGANQVISLLLLFFFGKFN